MNRPKMLQDFQEQREKLKQAEQEMEELDFISDEEAEECSIGTLDPETLEIIPPDPPVTN